MNTKRLLLLLVVMLLAVTTAVISSCDVNVNVTPGGETTDETTDTPEIGSTNTDAPDTTDTTEPPETSGDTIMEEKDILMGEEIALQSGSNEIKLVTENKKLLVTYLAAESGKNTVVNPVAYDFPDTIQIGEQEIDAVWQFVSSKHVTTDTTNEFVATYRDDDCKCDLVIRVKAHTDNEGPFEFITELKNGTDKTIRITPGSFASVSFNLGSQATAMLVKKESGQAEGFTHYDGNYVGGSGIYLFDTAERTSARAWVNTDQGWNESGFIPMIYLQGSDYGVYCALEWSAGAVRYDREGDEIEMSVSMDGVYGQFATASEFITRVDAGDTFLFPTVYYGAYDGEIDDGSNIFRRWFFDVKAPDKLREDKNEPLTQIGGMNDIDLMFVESTKWDYGWWSNDRLNPPNDWRSLEGAWGLADVKHPGYQSVLSQAGNASMKGYGAKLKAKGINWTVYLLLHDTLDAQGQPSDAYTEFNSVTHPEWFSNRKVTTGMGNSADLGNEECVEYLKTELTKFFGENFIPTWRTDFEPICRSSNLNNRHFANGSDVMYWCTTGFVDVVEHLIENVDGFRYESCSSGGSMKDLITATIAVGINCDDCANYLSLRTTFYDSTYVFHPTQMQIPMNMSFFNTNEDMFYPKVKSTCTDEDYDFHQIMIDMGFRSTILGSPMYGTWGGELLRSAVTEYSALYRTKIRPIQRDGELYHILPRPDGVNWDGMMYADPDSKNDIKGVVFLFKPSEQTTDRYTVVMDGLDPNVTYQLTFEDRPEQNCTAKGSVLMSAGIEVTIKSIGSELIWITEA